MRRRIKAARSEALEAQMAMACGDSSPSRQRVPDIGARRRPCCLPEGPRPAAAAPRAPGVVVLGLLLLVILNSCALAAAVPPADASPESLLSFYEYPGKPPTVSSRLVETREGYLAYEVTWESWVHTDYPSNNQVTAYYYQPRRSGKVPGVVLLHMYGTRTAKDERRLCGYLAGRGIACIMPYLPYHCGRTPRGHMSGRLMISGDVNRTVHAVRQAMIDVRSAVDWLQDRPEVDASRIGVVGISMGGILVHLAMGVEPRFTVGVSLLGGGGVADLMWSSPIIAHVRAELDRRGIGLDELRVRARAIEPLTFAGLNRPRHVLMIQGRYDAVVPARAARAMWRALGEPPIVWLDTGHYGAVLLRGRVADLMSAYLLNEFGEREGPLPRVSGYTLKAGLYMDDRVGLAGTVNVTLVHIGADGFVDLALTTDGPLIGISRTITLGVEAGVGMKVGDADHEIRPYLAFLATM